MRLNSFDAMLELNSRYSAALQQIRLELHGFVFTNSDEYEPVPEAVAFSQNLVFSQRVTVTIQRCGDSGQDCDVELGHDVKRMNNTRPGIQGFD